MELTQYIRLFRKWAWLIVVAAVIGGGIAYISAITQADVYQADTTIAIGGFIEQPNPNQGDIWTGINLATTYAQLVRTHDIMQATVDELGLPMSADRLSGLITTRIIPSTSLLVITAAYTDPVLAADIANTVAEQIILQSPTNLTDEQQAQIDFTNQQITDLNAQLRDARDRVALIDGQMSATITPDRTETLRSQRDSLITQINDASATVAQFTAQVASLRQRTNAVDIVEAARIPTSSTGSSPIRSALLGAMIGAALAVGVILLIEYMDDKIHSSEQAVELLKLPVLGAIQKYGSKDYPYPDMLVPSDVWSPVAEGFRVLRTNLLFSTSEKDDKSVYLITSAGPEEGKTVTTANLAVAMAQAGLHVLLIDADLRRPRVHEMFSLPNDFGLTNLLFADPSKKDEDASADLEESIAQNGMKLGIQDTPIPRLRVITSGFIPSNPTEILGSALMQRWTRVFLNSPSIDVVIFDTPPALVAADTAVLATNIDASVILVIEANRTRIPAARKLKEQFDQLDVRIRGVVLNRVNPREESYGYGYGYGYYYAPRPESNGKAPAEVQVVKK